MGRQKYLKRIYRLFEKSPVVDSGSIKRIIGSQYSKQLTHNLTERGKIIKITKGYYSIHDEPSLLVFCLAPAYLGLQDAMSHHNLWEQETIPVIITSRKVRQGMRDVMGTNVFVRRISPKYMFGLEYSGVFHTPYSDIEKTIIDMVYFGEHISNEVKNKANMTKLRKYLKRYPLKFRHKVLQYLNI